MSSPYRPNDSRTSSTLPRGPHLRDDSVIALACKRSEAATSTPERSGTGAPPGSASATNAVDATLICRAAAAARGATPATIVANRGAGTASSTASACQSPPSSSISCHPLPCRSNRSTPDLRPVEVGTPDQLVEQHLRSRRRSRRTPTRPWRRQRRADGLGEVARAAIQHRGQRRSGRPQPDRGGRSRVHPRQQRVDGTRHHLVAEPVTDQLGDGRVCTRAARSTVERVRRACARIVASSTSPVIDDGSVGMPLSVSRGSSCRRPWL